MVKCANCKKELKWYQIVHPFGSKEAFCGWGCWKEYKKKKKGHIGHNCPYCGSKKIHPVSIGQTKGFNTGRGCCGAILLGPLGWFCGMSEMNKGKTEAKRMCMKCGETF